MAEEVERMDWTVWQDADVALRFAQDRRRAMPGAKEQFDTLAQLLPPRPPDLQTAHILDMGCGDGILMEAILRQWPGSQGVALDGSPAMLEKAAERLSVFHPAAVTFVQADFSLPDWTRSVPRDQFEVVVSGFAIHHCEDARKKAIYQEVFDLLAPGGVFVNIEHVASAGAYGEELFERAYAQNLTRARREAGQNAAFEDVFHEINTRPDKSANRLTPVDTQLTWLREIGYENVDCYWKHYELAVLAGYKPHSHS